MTAPLPRQADDQPEFPIDPGQPGNIETATTSRLGGLADFVKELSDFARIGTESLPSTPGTDLPVRLEGVERITVEPQRRVLEARLDASGSLIIRPSIPGYYPEPSGISTVVVGHGPDQVVYTVARHWIDGTNRFGQDSEDYPHCLVNLPAWRRAPCDLRLAEWYATEQQAIDKYAPPTPEPEPSACVASFAGGIKIELKCETPSHWSIWEIRYGRAKRRTDFASPYFDHAKRTATQWYGEPLTDWEPLSRRPRPGVDVGQDEPAADLWSQLEEGGVE